MERAVPVGTSPELVRPRFGRRRGFSTRAEENLRQDGASPPLDRPFVPVRTTQRRRDGSSGDHTPGSPPGVSGRAAVSVNAVAGAVAGTLVSLVLHPVDTVKVAIQADRKTKRSITKVVTTMLKKRGPFGLYSGLGASLASAAPISALYTASYEAAKLKLAPLFPEEKQWIAHCVAGGVASVATSFVYTPSECVKQRCQVSGNLTAWRACTQIVGESGMMGLYKGWTAVLCRNIPQSAIKFFVFEKLMHTMYNSNNSGGQNTTPYTLAVGGIAGSTAAMFTTPFDTVKTRLQTRGVGGIENGVGGIGATARDIIKIEGVGGLYRGLLPRLFIYVTQGAVFFTSYEFVRRSLLECDWAKEDGKEDVSKR
ncbi:hypothetical protein N9L76_03910 [bacterium]|nr:hypothetical protein [bacterium]